MEGANRYGYTPYINPNYTTQSPDDVDYRDLPRLEDDDRGAPLEEDKEKQEKAQERLPASGRETMEAEANNRLDPQVKLKREYETLAAFLEDPCDQIELKELFDIFEEDSEAYKVFKESHDTATSQVLMNLIREMQTELADMRKSDLNLEELLNPQTIKMLMGNVILKIGAAMIEKEKSIENEMERKGHFNGV